jgi:hypothetical protein
MRRSELVGLLNTLPDDEVITPDGDIVTGATISGYDDGSGTHDAIVLDLSED